MSPIWIIALIVAVLVVTVVPFVLYLRHRDRATEKFNREAFAQMTNECHKFHRELNDKNTDTFKLLIASLNHNSEVVTRNNELLRRFENGGSVRT